MSIFRENIMAMEGYRPGEQPRDGGYVKLNTNENPYPSSPRVQEVIMAEIDRLNRYPDPMATRFCARAAEVCGVTEECVLAGNGSDDLLTIITRAIASEGDLVVSPVPTYTLYKTLCEIQGARYLPVPYGDDYSLDVTLVPEDAKIVFVCNPNSPSGTALPAALLEEIAGRISGILVVDEAYVDFAEENARGVLATHSKVIILRSLSKSYSLAGLRIGYAVAKREVITQLAKVKDSYNVNRIAAAAGLAALEDHSWMQYNREKILATRERLAKCLNQLGFTVYPSHANFILARSRKIPAGQVFQELKKRKILVRYYATERLNECLRISIGTDEEIDMLLDATRDIITA